MERSKRFLGMVFTAIPLISIFFLVGCTKQPSSPIVTARLISESTTQIEETALPNPSQTPYPTAPIELEPTLTFDHAVLEILLMVETNGECRLPCMWGFTPGVSTEKDIERVHSRFSPEYLGEIHHLLIDRFDDLGGITMISRENDIQINLDMSYYFRDQSSLQLVEFKAKSFKVIGSGIDLKLEYIFGNDELQALVNYYTLPEILTEYGSPSSILIAPNFYDSPVAPPPSWLWYSVVLVYQDQGFLAEYIMPRRWIGDSLAACVNQITEMTIIGWDPQQELELSEVLSIKSGLGIHVSNISYFKSLEEATALSIPEFTDIFRDPGTDACVFTPLDLWPHPTIPD